MKLKAFLYLLAQKKLPFGDIEDCLTLVDQLAATGSIDYEDKNLEAWIDSVLERLEVRTSRLLVKRVS